MKKILLVDDSPFIHTEVQEILQICDEFTLAGCATSGEEALDMYDKIRPDVVLMDLILPGMDGIEALKKLRASWPEIRVVMNTSLAYDEVINEMQQAGIQQVIFKPIKPATLLHALRKALKE